MEKDPKPTSEILSPFFKEAATLSMNASNAFLASAFVNSAEAEIASMSSCLFMVFVFVFVFVYGNKCSGGLDRCKMQG
jgi:hypothetical protein